MKTAVGFPDGVGWLNRDCYAMKEKNPVRESIVAGFVAVAVGMTASHLNWMPEADFHAFYRAPVLIGAWAAISVGLNWVFDRA